MEWEKLLILFITDKVLMSNAHLKRKLSLQMNEETSDDSTEK